MKKERKIPNELIEQLNWLSVYPEMMFGGREGRVSKKK